MRIDAAQLILGPGERPRVMWLLPAVDDAVTILN